jgi:hypothetical protein
MAAMVSSAVHGEVRFSIWSLHPLDDHPVEDLVPGAIFGQVPPWSAGVQLPQDRRLDHRPRPIRQLAATNHRAQLPDPQ